MKKILVSIVACMGLLTAYAGPVSQQQALAVAKQYMAERQVVTRASEPVDLELAFVCHAGDRLDGSEKRVVRAAGEASAPLYYVFNKGEAQGFLVIAGDDAVEPVLAVTDEGSFALEEVNPGLRWWLVQMQNRLQEVALRNKVEVLGEPADAGLKPFVEPLIQTKWGQRSPYNDTCPVDNVDGNGKRSATGCTATALAQIVYYWKYPKVVNQQVKYTTGMHKWVIDEDLSKYPLKYDLMRETYTGEESAEEKQAVADLMYVCGLMMHMDYCALGSATFMNSYGLHLMGLNGKEMMADFRGIDEWTATMKRELSEGRPIAMDGQSAFSGHSFVCDGYDKDDLFHINWGWEGYNNGYFNLAMIAIPEEELTDEPNEFNTNLRCIVGIEPMKEGDKPLHVAMHCQHVDFLQLEYDSVRVLLYHLSLLSDKLEGDLRIEITTEQDEHVGWLTEPYRVSMERDNFYSMPFTVIDKELSGAWPQTVKDGRYRLRVMFKEKEDTDYEVVNLMRSVTSSDYEVVEVRGKELIRLTELRKVKLSCSDVEVSRPFAESPYGVRFTLKNEGDEYQGLVYLLYYDMKDEMHFPTYVSVRLKPQEEVKVHMWCELPKEVNYDELLLVADSTSDYLLVLQEIPLEIEEKATGDPILEVTELTCMNKQPITTTDVLKMKMKLTNQGGFWQTKLFAFLLTPDTNEEVTRTRMNEVMLNKGDTTEVMFEITPPAAMNPGKYVVECYSHIPNERYLMPIKGGRLMLEMLDATGVEQVVIPTEVPEDAVIFTLQGVRMLQPWKLLPRGIYLVNGRKMMKVK